MVSSESGLDRVPSPNITDDQWSTIDEAIRACDHRELTDASGRRSGSTQMMPEGSFGSGASYYDVCGLRSSPGVTTPTKIIWPLNGLLRVTLTNLLSV